MVRDRDGQAVARTRISHREPATGGGGDQAPRGDRQGEAGAAGGTLALGAVRGRLRKGARQSKGGPAAVVAAKARRSAAQSPRVGEVAGAAGASTVGPRHREPLLAR